MAHLRSNVLWNVSGDLFDMLLPMLSIYQEYVRNHHYSLQVLTECKSNTNFATVLKRLEGEPTSWWREKRVWRCIFSETPMSEPLFGDILDVSDASDSTLHHHTSRAVGSHASWPCWAKELAECQAAARRSQQVIKFSAFCSTQIVKRFFLPLMSGKCTTRYPKPKICVKT